VSIRIGYLPLALVAVVYGVLFSLSAYGYTYYGCNPGDSFSEGLCIVTRTALITLVVLWPVWAVILSRYSGDDIGRFVVPLGLSFVLMLPGALFLLVFYSFGRGW